MNEADLIQRWQQGQADAFDALYSQHSPTIYRLGWAMLRDREEAADVVQETFLRAHKARHRFDPSRAAFGTWLYQIALNYCRGRLRRKRLLTVPWFSHLIDTEARPGADRPGPEAQLLRNEYQRALWEAIEGLSDRLKEVIILHYYLNIPAVEIAKMLDCPEGTVYSRLHNARRSLAEQLGQQGLATPDLPEVQNAP